MRKFTIINFPNVNDTYGIFKGNTPGQAAKKALNSLSRKIDFKNNSNKYMVFSIKEIGKDKVYTYYGTRVELATPEVVNINNKVVQFKYKTTVAQYNKN